MSYKMPNWDIVRTDNFLKDLKKFRKVNELLAEIDNKILKLKKEPGSIGKQLHGGTSSL